jgi:hypothetical protein
MRTMRTNSWQSYPLIIDCKLQKCKHFSSNSCQPIAISGGVA